MSAQHDRSTFCALMHIYHMYISLHFQRIQSLLDEIKSHSKAEGSTFFDTMRLSSFFRHCENVQISIFSEIVLLFPHQFLMFCNRMDVHKIQKGPPFTFYALCDLPKFSKKKSKRKFGNFFSQFLVFLGAFVVSSCKKK